MADELNLMRAEAEELLNLLPEALCKQLTREYFRRTQRGGERQAVVLRELMHILYAQGRAAAIAADRASRAAEAQGEGLTIDKPEFRDLLDLWDSADSVASEERVMPKITAHLNRAIAAHLRAAGKGGDGEIVELARKLVEYFPDTLDGMYCDGVPVGRQLVASVAKAKAEEQQG